VETKKEREKHRDQNVTDQDEHGDNFSYRGETPSKGRTFQCPLMDGVKKLLPPILPMCKNKIHEELERVLSGTFFLFSSLMGIFKTKTLEM